MGTRPSVRAPSGTLTSVFLDHCLMGARLHRHRVNIGRTCTVTEATSDPISHTTPTRPMQGDKFKHWHFGEDESGTVPTPRRSAYPTANSLKRDVHSRAPTSRAATTILQRRGAQEPFPGCLTTTSGVQTRRPPTASPARAGSAPRMVPVAKNRRGTFRIRHRQTV